MIRPLTSSRTLTASMQQQATPSLQVDLARRSHQPRPSGLKSRIFIGMGLVAILLGGVGGWSATAQLSGAIIVPGQLVIDGNAKKIQHQSGGIVRAIAVKNGDRVTMGDVVLTLDETQTGAQLGIIDSKIIRLASEKARLEAERDGRADIAFPRELDATDTRAKSAVAGERRLLRARRDGWQSQIARLRERIDQSASEVIAIQAQRTAKEREITLIKQELAMVEKLRDKNLTSIGRLIAMQREEARYEGESGALMAQEARVKSQKTEIETQLIELDQKILTDANAQIRLIESQLSELQERRIAAADDVTRTALRTPVSGIVHDLAVSTVGGVLAPGETAMMIVPDRDALTLEVRVSPIDIDKVTIGQSARLRFSALNQSTTPELSGTVMRVAADVSRDIHSGREFYVARIGLQPGEVRKLGNTKLIAGMPVDGFIETGRRTALSYILKPFKDHLERAMTED